MSVQPCVSWWYRCHDRHVSAAALTVRAFSPGLALQRLSVSTGYGVAELAVLAGADMVGTTLGESTLRERDITVLTLHRGTAVIPNPKRNTVLEAGDRLLCFGKLDEMRSMVPERQRRRRRVRKLPAIPPIE